MVTTTISPSLEKKLQRYENMDTNSNAAAVPIPIPIPLIAGSKFLIWKQDPTVIDPGIRLSFFHRLL